MAIIKCKMCGGDLVIEQGNSVAECEYCGTLQTVPNVDDEKKITLFARANRLRSNNEFDKASGIYEAIITDFPEEAEAYWGLVLCKYGIEYVDDPATAKKIPTCHRSSFESVMDDNNFELTLEYADVVARKVYREEAKQIEEIRKGIIEVSSKEEPYDIFICYKETDGNGDRTIDSVLAQDIYDALNEKGYRTFFARITLEDKLGMEYEPYIFAALSSAKIMLAVGTDYEYYNAVWVKNEWSRFLRLMETDKTKHLIPCYKNIDAYDMPKEFAKLQAQDLGKVGAMQDLLRGIEKLLPKTPSSKSTPIIADVTAESLLERAYILLRDGDYARANGYFDKVLDRAPKNPKAYWGKLLSSERCIDNAEFTGYKKTSEYFRRLLSKKDALEYSDTEFISELQNLWGNSYKNALQFASDEDKGVFEGCFEKIRLASLELLHNEQSKLLEERKRIELEKQKEAERLRKKQEAEEQKTELLIRKAKEDKRRQTIRRRIYYASVICIEVAFVLLMFLFDFQSIINESAGGFVCVNLVILANAVVMAILDGIEKFKFGGKCAVGVNTVLAIVVFLSAMSAMGSFVIGIFGFFFFGAIEYGVVYLSNYIATK